LFTPPDPPLHPALASHASNPLALPLGDDLVRIFYNGRDATNRSAIGAVDVDLSRLEIATLHREPFLLPGAQGTFCADGVSIGGWLDQDGGRWLLFMGWTLLGAGRWRGAIGRIAITADGRFEDSVEQLLEAGVALDPLSLSYPCAFRDAGGISVMLYESTQPGEPPTHPLHAATSRDGATWQRMGVALGPVTGLTTGYSRPSVLRIRDHWHLWASRLGAMGERYHIAHAASPDGRTWTADREAALLPSGEGWDSAMVCYPSVFEHGGSRYMLYNGNDFGRSGFGLARWDGA
jgi:hypothetical protein